MAYDWIKMRRGLSYDPDVISISCDCDISQDLTVGKLHKLWSWADEHCANGHAPSVTVAFVNSYLDCAGFAEAMESVGWLEISTKGLTFPNFELHNGKSGKSRALSAKRSAGYRRNNHAPSVTESERMRDLHNTTQHNIIEKEKGNEIANPYPNQLVEQYGSWTNKDAAIRAAAGAIIAVRRERRIDLLDAFIHLQARIEIFHQLRKLAYRPNAVKWFEGEFDFDIKAEEARSEADKQKDKPKASATTQLVEEYNKNGGDNAD